MKKVIGILSVAVLAVTMAMSANTNSLNSNLDLASLMAISTADAECTAYNPNNLWGTCTPVTEWCAVDPLATWKDCDGHWYP